MPSQFEPYLEQIETPLRAVDEAERALFRAEAEAHLEALYDDARLHGLSHEDALREATRRFGAPRILSDALDGEALLHHRRRVRREIALRVVGALALPLFALALLACFAPQENGAPSFRLGGGIGLTPRGDVTITGPFLLGLAAAGYQAVARRRTVAALLAGVLGAVAATPLGIVVALGIETAQKILPVGRESGGSLIGQTYGLHLVLLLPSAGLLFAAWCAALGTRPRRAAVGGALFALATYLLFQVRDCFVQPDLWPQMGAMLAMAGLYFVLPAAALGLVYAALGRLGSALARKLLAPRRGASGQAARRIR